MGAIRKGVGKLVAACDVPPLVVPFVHSGMEQVMPRGKVLPSFGKKVRILVGRPIPMDDLLLAVRQQGWSEDTLHTAVAARVSRHLRVLKTALDSDCPSVDSGAGAGDLAAGLLPDVSGLDHYDVAEKWFHGASMWEKAKFRMQHRAWSLGSAQGLAEGNASGPSGSSSNRSLQASCAGPHGAAKDGATGQGGSCSTATCSPPPITGLAGGVVAGTRRLPGGGLWNRRADVPDSWLLKLPASVALLPVASEASLRQLASKRVRAEGERVGDVSFFADYVSSQAEAMAKLFKGGMGSDPFLLAAA